MRFLCFNTSTTYSKPRFNPVFFFLPVIPTVLVQLIYRGIKTSEMTALRLKPWLVQICLCIAASIPYLECESKASV